MNCRGVLESHRPNVEPAGARRFWHYEGVGWRESVAKPRFWVLAVCVIVPLTVYGYVVIGPRGRIEPGRPENHKTDFTVFTEAGAAFFDGRDPYRVSNPRGWHYLYPPLFALLIAPLSLFDTESQVVIWYAVNVALTFLCFGEARRLWRLVSAPAGSGRSRWIVVCAVLAALLPFFDCLQAGQLGIAILYLLTLGFRLFIEGRSWPARILAGVVLALPAVVKLVPALPVVFLLVQQWSSVAFSNKAPRRWRPVTALSAGVLAGVYLFLLAIPASLIGWQKNLAYLNVWHAGIVSNQRVGETANFNFRSARNQSFANAVHLAMNSSSRTEAPVSRASVRLAPADRMVHPAVRVVIGAALALLLAVGLALSRRNTALDQATAFSLALCATLLVSPLAWGHYYMVQLLAVLCVPLWLSRRGMPRLARLVAALPPILSWAYYVGMPYTGELGLLGLGTALWFLVACGLILGMEVWAKSSDAAVREPGGTGNARLHRSTGKHRLRPHATRPAPTRSVSGSSFKQNPRETR